MAKTDRRAQYTKMVLKQSLMGLMQEKPLAKITIKELCLRADVNRCTFYAHYADQYDLLKCIEDEILGEIQEKLANYSFREDQTAAYQIIERILLYAQENSKFCRILLSEQGDPAFQKRLMNIAQRQYVSEWTREKAMDEETAQYLYLYAVNGSIGIVHSWLKNGMKKTAREMADIIIKLVNQGMSAFA